MAAGGSSRGRRDTWTPTAARPMIGAMCPPLRSCRRPRRSGCSCCSRPGGCSWRAGAAARSALYALVPVGARRSSWPIRPAATAFLSRSWSSPTSRRSSPRPERLSRIVRRGARPVATTAPTAADEERHAAGRPTGRRRPDRERGPVALHGGGEFLPGDEASLAALLRRPRRASAAGRPIRVVIVPTAAARQRPDLAAAQRRAAFERVAAARRARRRGRRRSRSWTRRRAADPGLAARSRAADLIHFPGGDPDLIPTRHARHAGLGRDPRRRTPAAPSWPGRAPARWRSAPWTWTPGGGIDGLGVVPGLAVVPHARRRRPGRRTLERFGAWAPDGLGVARARRADRRRSRSRRPVAGATIRWRVVGAGRGRAGCARSPTGRRRSVAALRARRSTDAGGSIPMVQRPTSAGGSTRPSRSSTTARSGRARSRCSRPSARCATGWRREPVRFLNGELPSLLDEARERGRRASSAPIPRASPSCPTPRPASTPSSRRSASSPATSCWPTTTSTTRRSTRCARSRPRGRRAGRRRAHPVPDRRPGRGASRRSSAAVTPRTRLASSATSRARRRSSCRSRELVAELDRARHRHARRRRPRAGHGAGRPRRASAPRTGPATATSGCAGRRARRVL